MKHFVNHQDLVAIERGRFLFLKYLLLLLEVSLGLDSLTPIESTASLVLVFFTETILLLFGCFIYDVWKAFRWLKLAFVYRSWLANNCEQLVITETGSVLALTLEKKVSMLIGEDLSDLTVGVGRWHTAHVDLLLCYLAVCWVHN